MFRSIIHISLTALLVFSILAPSFVELISDIEIVEIADINDKEKKEKLGFYLGRWQIPLCFGCSLRFGEAIVLIRKQERNANEHTSSTEINHY